MNHLRYPRKRMLELLAMEDDALRTIEEQGVLAEDGGPRDEYTPADLSHYRTRLERIPKANPPRRQLFLNFKGGTGKTSLSVSYAHRLAEIGYRVLMIDVEGW